MSLFTNIIGYAAAVFGTIMMLPQVYKILKTRQVDDLSMVMLVVYIINCSLWETYGLLRSDMPMILCNLIAGMIGILQVILKLKFQTKK